MNKSELVSTVAEKVGLSAAQAGEAVNAVIEAIHDSVAKGNKVSLPGFMTIDVVHRPAREGRNPATGETIKIAARKAVKLSPGSKLKEAAAGKK